MNRQIRMLFRLSAAGVVLLITMTAYWQVWAASSLQARSDNARLVFRQLEIKRGMIYASDGRTVLARNRPVRRNGFTLYERVYPQGATFAQAVGYNTVGQGRTGLELYDNAYLTGSTQDLASQLTSLGDQLQGQTVTGDNIVTSLSVPAQRTAMAALGANAGAVVAIQPDSGRVLVMASTPSFDPNTVSQRYARLIRPGSGSPLLNRATQGLYAPGSTFKVVTSTAALDSGRYTPSTIIDAKGHCIIDQTLPLCNDGTESFGNVTFEFALVQSVNTVFGQVGMALGQNAIERTMRDYGFFASPALDYPYDEMEPSGLYHNGGLLSPLAPVDVGRLAIGQERLQVTPFQMAEVVATVANGGLAMRPTMLDRAVSPSGRVVFHSRPQPLQRVMSTARALELNQMMRKVVEEGTGQTANFPGLSVAGKTGTAQT
ncbi:MAG TPA: penicillin-binding transpeptidase domain-containing protein, partial [Gaiellales bacterium]|nr:penicillin-binding transpeptidase domain-containing protein [Gaiellales bacterium]